MQLLLAGDMREKCPKFHEKSPDSLEAVGVGM